MNFNKRVYYICNEIPKGKVATYGQIAIIAENPRAARQVGWALNKNNSLLAIPAHRVINRLGFLSGASAFSKDNEQKELLVSEGVVVSDDLKVDLSIYRWNPSIEKLEEIEKHFIEHNI